MILYDINYRCSGNLHYFKVCLFHMDNFGITEPREKLEVFIIITMIMFFVHSMPTAAFSFGRIRNSRDEWCTYIRNKVFRSMNQYFSVLLFLVWPCMWSVLMYMISTMCTDTANSVALGHLMWLIEEFVHHRKYLWSFWNDLLPWGTLLTETRSVLTLQAAQRVWLRSMWIP